MAKRTKEQIEAERVAARERAAAEERERIHAENVAIGLADEGEHLDSAEAELAEIEVHWDAAVARAKAMPEGGLHSVWTMPVADLASRRRKVLERLGVDVDSLEVPGGDPDEHECKLPEAIRSTYRHGHALKAHAHSALRARRADHAARKRRGHA